jgi:nicotinamide mononucleotide adenylyltransferase
MAYGVYPLHAGHRKIIETTLSWFSLAVSSSV